MRTLLLSAAVLPVFGLMAQTTQLTQLAATPQVACPVKKDPAPGSPKALNIVFSEDFDLGLTGNNGVGPWTTAGPDGAIWMGDVNGPNGDFSNPATEKINSTTAANGFMIFDSNLSNPGGVLTNRVGYLQSPVLDLSTTPDVQLKFEQRFRWCCSATPGHWVDVSLDGGLSWPFRMNMGQGALHDPSVANWDIGTHTKWIDLSQILAGGASSVAFRFAHEDANVIDGTISHYHWQVDDVQLIATPAYDPQLVLAQYDNFFPSDLVFSANTGDLEYTVYPFDQLSELTLKAKIRNGGTVDLTGVDFTAEVFDASSTSIFSQTAALPGLARYATDSLQFSGFTPPAIEGDYTVEFHTAVDSTDDHPADNDFTKTFSVDSFLYAFDDGSMNGRTNTNDGAEFEAANKFFIHVPADLYAIRVGFAVRPTNTFPTSAGILVTANIYDGVGAWIAESQEYEIELADLNNNQQSKFVDMIFDDPVNLPVGEYMATVHHLGGDPVWIATSGISEVGSSLLVQPNVSDPAAVFFVQNNTPMIRLNFDPNVGVGISEHAQGMSLGQNVPNPADGTTRIPYDLSTAATVSFDVRDARGRLALRSLLGTKPAGMHRFILDTATMPAGIYVYTLHTDDVRISRRMTVIH